MKRILKIVVTTDYHLQVLLVELENKETVFKLIEDKEEIDPCISFNGNFITIGKENETSIDFMKEWIENPDEYKMYSVLFQGKEYSVLSEVLFALIINEYKQKIERENIIKCTWIKRNGNIRR